MSRPFGKFTRYELGIFLYMFLALFAYAYCVMPYSKKK
jgi:hypothetical protein